MTEEKFQHEDEIELIDILRFIWNWKYLIVIGTVVCALTAAIISFYMPKTYRIETVLKPVMLDFNINGQPINSFNPSDISSIAESRALKNEILNKIRDSNITTKVNSLNYNVNSSKKTNTVIITYETPFVEMGIDILNHLINLLTIRVLERPEIIFLKKKFKDEKRNLDSELSLMTETERHHKSSINSINKRFSELQLEIKNIDDEIAKLGVTKEDMLKNKDKNAAISSFLFNNNLQQKIVYKNQIQKELYNLEEDKEITKIELQKSKGRLQLQLIKIDELEQKNNNLKPLQVIQPPSSTSHPLKPDTKWNILISSLAGLFIMLILSFLLEYISKYRSLDKK